MIVQTTYVASAVLFILSLKWMSEVKTSRRGNWAGTIGMIGAVVATLFAIQLHRYDLLAIAIVVGALIGIPMALKMPMTAVPQRTAISHAFGSLAAALVGTAEFYQHTPNIEPVTMAIIAAEVILGYLTFTGSVIAFAKLQELISGRPLLYPGRRVVSFVTLGLAVIAGIILTIHPEATWAFPVIIFFSLIFGFLLVMAIGGADMPTVISILNAFAGLSASGLGLILNNKLLIIAGALDGSSGLILSILMCKAMNRSFANVMFGGFGATSPSVAGAHVERPMNAIEPVEAAQLLIDAQKVVIAPGYGMAAAQAQHAVKELADELGKRNIDVKYAIHPVAGRMPGHMNVLLAEADVPYTQLLDMEEINPEFDQTDVVIVIGANDVVNPAARNDKGSPIYGMPILNVDHARTIIVIKRGRGTGFSGIDNELFYNPKTMMLFGSAKDAVQKLTAAVKAV